MLRAVRGTEPRTVKPSAFRYRSTHDPHECPSDHPDVCEEMKRIAGRRGRFGRARESESSLNASEPGPTQPNVRWSLDLLAKALSGAHNSRILAVNGDCCRKNL